MRSVLPSLEINTRRKLQLTPRLLTDGIDRAERSSRPIRVETGGIRSIRQRYTIVNVRIRICELRRVEEVVRLRTQLESHTLRNREVFEQPEVHNVISRPKKLIPLHVSSSQVRSVRVLCRRSEDARKIGSVIRVSGATNKRPRRARKIRCVAHHPARSLQH